MADILTLDSIVERLPVRIRVRGAGGAPEMVRCEILPADALSIVGGLRVQQATDELQALHAKGAAVTNDEAEAMERALRVIVDEVLVASPEVKAQITSTTRALVFQAFMELPRALPVEASEEEQGQQSRPIGEASSPA